MLHITRPVRRNAYAVLNDKRRARVAHQALPAVDQECLIYYPARPPHPSRCAGSACTVAMTTPLDSSDKAHTCFSFMPLKRNVTACRRRSFSAAIGSSLLSLRSIADIPVGIIDVV
jgi:hypothetical protein